MAADTTAPATKRRAPGPRTPKPVFAIVSYQDEQGQAVSLDKNRLNIQIERDSAKIVELLTGGDNSLAGAAVVRVELPQPQKRNTGNAPASA